MQDEGTLVAKRDDADDEEGAHQVAAHSALVHVSSGENLPSPVPVVIPFSTAHATALA